MSVDSYTGSSTASADFTGAFPSGAGSSLSALPSLSKVDGLSGRETQIVGLLRDGYSNKQIARKIFVSEATVKFHLKNLYRKLGARSRTHAVLVAHGNGVFPTS